jgi:hypothetical protein
LEAADDNGDSDVTDDDNCGDRRFAVISSPPPLAVE